jgi:catechol 2,3-dioxygenase-like lactoylglutathione lyase family enzyme
MQDHLTHFMLIVKDIQRSVDFYRDKLGCTVESVETDWAELKLGNGLSLALRKKSPTDPIGSSGIGFRVKDCRLATDALKARGVEFVRDCEHRVEEKDVLSQFTDPDGDIIWLVQKL